MKSVKTRILGAAVALISLVLAACSNGINSQGPMYGKVVLTAGNGRELVKSEIEKADVRIIGSNKVDMSIEDVAIGVEKEGSGTAPVASILYGTNYAVKVQAKKTINNVLSEMDGVCLYSVFTVDKDVVEVPVNWSTSVLGKVVYDYIGFGGNAETLNLDDVEALLGSREAGLVDTEKLAYDLYKKRTGLKAADYVLEPAKISFSGNISDSDAVAIVCDPLSSKVTGISTTVKTIEKVAPGTWNFYLLKNGTIIYSQAVTCKAGETVEIDEIVLQVPAVRVEDADGKAASLEVSGTATVYLACRTLDGEEAFAVDGIYYTLDGTNPTSKSTKYTSAGVKVTGGTVLKAIAVKNGLADSVVTSATFVSSDISTKLGEMHPSAGAFSVVSNPTSGEPGAVYKNSNVVFSVYSENATKMLLEIYDKAYGSDAKYDYWMTKGNDNYWRVEVKDVPNYTLYGFRAWGPNWTFDEKWERGDSTAGFVADYDSNGNRFNPNKVLFDPYAKEMSHDASNPQALAENGKSHTNAELCSGDVNRAYDSGRFAPKGVVIQDDTSTGSKPAIAQKDAIIYEAHPRGITKHPSSSSLSTILKGIEGFEAVEDVPAEYRGTYKGAAYLAPYFKALGINTIELLPVHESDNDCNPDDAPGGNYWAYMTFDYFAPDRRYSYDKSLGGPTREFKEMVKAFHDAGIEVYLDVVYNHTGEGGPWNGDSKNPAYDQRKQCEIVSMRGLDNRSWYSLVTSDKSAYWETTGCGNNMQCDNTMVRQFILDSLEYWITKMGVDGFRFDLATVLGREYDSTTGNWNYSKTAKTLVDIMSLGTKYDAEMIAESWDCGDGSYQVGNFPAGWGGWNGRFRDAIRNYVGAGKAGAANDYIYGDKTNFLAEGGPHKSVNFVVAHDGFTLADLCSYAGTGNALNSTLKWPFGPSDGGNGDLNSIAGDTQEMKRQSARNYFAIQMMSRGVPMIVWGDELSRTQKGNNNAYNIDSVGTWTNYNMISTDSPHKVATGGTGASYDNNFGTFKNNANVNGNFVFANYMMKLRESDPALRQDNYDSVEYSYYDNTGVSLAKASQAVAIKIAGSSVTGGHDYYMMMNMGDGECSFTFPAPKSGYYWTRIVDTGSWAENKFNCWADGDDEYSRTVSDKYGVGAKTVTILKQVVEGTQNKVRSPVITVSSGKITITSETTGASIYYTTDGSLPSATNGTLYTAPFTVASGTNVIARAFKTGMIASNEKSKLYIEGIDLVLTCESSYTWIWDGGCPMFAKCTTSSGTVWAQCSMGSGKNVINVTVPNGTTSLICQRFPVGTTDPDQASEIYNTSSTVTLSSGKTSYSGITWK